MFKKSDILSILVLAVYGTLALVVVPLHHHSLEYRDTPVVHSASQADTINCDVCTFSSTPGIGDDAGTVAASLAFIDDLTVPSPVDGGIIVVLTAISRRGPPSILS